MDEEKRVLTLIIQTRLVVGAKASGICMNGACWERIGKKNQTNRNLFHHGFQGWL